MRAVNSRTNVAALQRPLRHCGLSCSALARGAGADVHALEQQIRAHAQFIVLTENAVGFENGGQCVSSNRETYPLYVSKPAAKETAKSLVVESVTCTCTRARVHFSHSSTLVCALKTWCFSWLCDYLTLHSKQRLHANDTSRNVGKNTDVLNHITDQTLVAGTVNNCFTELGDCFELSVEYYTVNSVC